MDYSRQYAYPFGIQRYPAGGDSWKLELAYMGDIPIHRGQKMPLLEASRETILERELNHERAQYRELRNRVRNHLATLERLLRISESEALSVCSHNISRSLRGHLAVIERLYDSIECPQAPDYLVALCEDVFAILDPENDYNFETSIRVPPFRKERRNAKFLSVLGMVVNELLSNAVKYGNTRNEGGYIKISIHSEMHNLILRCESTIRTRNATEKPQTGTGEGLSILQALVSQYEGALRVSHDTEWNVEAVFPL